MTNTQVIPSSTEGIRTGTDRVVSIDIFRGLTMAVMIFVNALSEVRGLPRWTYHAPAEVDVMTYVDMVFPFFLFAVGLSLPLSVSQRLRRNASMPALWFHVAFRSATLIVLGLILANAEKADRARMGMSGGAWALLALVCAAMFLNVYPKSERYQAWFRILRILGFVGVVVLLALFRRATSDDGSAWLDASYPEILGLIGFSYFAVALLYIPTRRWRWAPAVWFVLLVALCALSTARLVPLPGNLPFYFWPFDNGAMACIIMAGVVTSSIVVRPDRPFEPGRALALAAGFGLMMLAAGRVFVPLGISKIRATPTWSLYSIGAAVLLFALLFWVCDVKRKTAWAFFVRPAGSNTLTTYLLPDLWIFLMGTLGITYYDTHLSSGWPAVVKTFAFTFLILAVSGVLTKAKVRLQL
jgi:heparan-alpha-glucosaminide N-acetyltransferase